MLTTQHEQKVNILKVEVKENEQFSKINITAKNKSRMEATENITINGIVQ